VLVLVNIEVLDNRGDSVVVLLIKAELVVSGDEVDVRLGNVVLVEVFVPVDVLDMAPVRVESKDIYGAKDDDDVRVEVRVLAELIVGFTPLSDKIRYVIGTAPI